MKKGKLEISKKLGVKISAKKENGKSYKISVPKEFVFTDRTHHGKECEFEDDGTKVIKIMVDGQEIPKDASIAKAKEDAKAQKAAAEKERLEAERKKPKQNRKKENVHEYDLFDISETCLPYDVMSSGIQDVDNFYLKFHKYARYKKFDKEKEFKLFFVESVKRDKNIYEIKFDFKKQKPLIEQAYKDQYQSALGLHSEGNVATAEFKVDWRLVVGLGGASVYETSMTLHHLYGFPYIPASGIKGMVRAYVCTQVSPYEGKQKDVDAIFGTENEVGKIIFYDGLPKTPPHIKPDVMNPHYTPYYQPKNTSEPPADYHKPVPVNFLTVTDTVFGFTIGVRKNIGEIERKHLLQKTEQWLKEALEEQGIGAKTAVGYGYMS